MAATAIIAAAGSGERLGGGGPKAFVELAGRPLVEWSLRAFAAAEAIGPVLVAVPSGCEGRISGDGVEAVRGGASRSESVANAMERVSTDLVVVHDAARPLVTPELINAVVGELEAADADCLGVVAATGVTDTIKEVYRGTEVSRTLDRSSLWAAQTPQAFRAEALREALASASPLSQATDDATLVERVRGTRGRVMVHQAPAENIKVTNRLDLQIAEMLLKERQP